MQEMLETFLDYRFLFDIAVILLSTKLCGMLTRRFYMPQVVGALLAGLLLGPAILKPLFGFSILEETDFIDSISEIGVIVLMFTAGLDTNIKDLKKVGVSSTIVATIGVIVPLLMGWGVAAIFGAGENMLQHVFIGVILTATSVSITVETLKELGKLNTKVANTILGAAVIDDILGIIVLTIISSMADSSVSIWVTLLKILLFFVFVGVCAVAGYYLFSRWFSHSSKDLRRHVIVSFVFCLLMSLAAEVFFGVADITGAFFAGLILSSTTAQPYLNARFGTLSYMFLSPVFFASIGLKVSVEGMGATVWIFAGALVVVAIINKDRRLLSGSTVLQVQSSRRNADRHRHGKPGRSGFDCGQQRVCTGTDERYSLCSGDPGGYRHYYCFPHSVKDCLPGEKAKAGNPAASAVIFENISVCSKKRASS